MKKLLTLAVLGCGVAALLTGCASAEDAVAGDSDNTLRVFAVELPGDRTVDCVASDYTSNVTAPDCNWEGVHSGVPSSDEKKNSSLQSYTVKIEDGQEVLCVASIYGSNVIQPDCDWNSINEAR